MKVNYILAIAYLFQQCFPMTKMKAAFISKYGPDEKLQFGDFDIPVMGESDVLVEIVAASLNPIDFKIRDGKLRFVRPYVFPLIMGHDLSGIVVDVGNKVSRFKKGDKVFSRPRNGRTGSLAQFIAIDESEVARMPLNINFSEAASLPLVGLTGWQALLDVGDLKPGSRVFIQAGSGGIGTFAIQLAKHFGAHVITSTSTKNIEFVRALGADEVIDYKNQKFEDVLKDIDIVFDTLGGEALYKSFQVLRPGGIVVSISGDPDQQLANDMQLNVFKSLVLRFVGRKAHALAKKYRARYRFIFMKSKGSQLESISALIEKEKIKPIIDREFSFEDSQAAIDYLEGGHARGKVVIKIKE